MCNFNSGLIVFDYRKKQFDHACPMCRLLAARDFCPELSTVERGGGRGGGAVGDPPSLCLWLWLCLSQQSRNCLPRTTTDPAPCNWEPARACAMVRWASVCPSQARLARSRLSVLRNTAIAPWSCCLHRHPIRLSWIFLSRQVKHRLTARYFAAIPFSQDWQVVVHLPRSSSNNFYRLILPLKWPLRFQLLNLKSHNKQILIIHRVTVTTHERKFLKTNRE